MQPQTRLINHIIQKKGYASYLEIGVNNPANNFDLIRVQYKIGVDPNGRASFTGTSDEFFEQNKMSFDIVFIDGLHHYDQVIKDFVNSYQRLNEGGLICIHDTDPKEERFTAVPRKERGRWNGDVYKILQVLQLKGIDLDWISPVTDINGFTAIKKITYNDLGDIVGANMDFSNFIKLRTPLLRPCTFEEFDEWI